MKREAARSRNRLRKALGALFEPGRGAAKDGLSLMERPEG